MTNTDVTWSTVVWTQRRDNSNWLQYYKSTNHLWQSYSVYYCIWCADIVLVYFRRCIVMFCLMFFTTSYILYENWLLFYFLTNHCTCTQIHCIRIISRQRSSREVPCYRNLNVFFCINCKKFKMNSLLHGIHVIWFMNRVMINGNAM